MKLFSGNCAERDNLEVESHYAIVQLQLLITSLSSLQLRDGN